MPHFKFRIFLFLVVVLFSSCTIISSNDTCVIEQAEVQATLTPDSALYLLDSLINPLELNEAQFNLYTLVYVQAKNNCGLSIAGDTAIYRAADYFSNHKDLKRAALAALLSERVKAEAQKVSVQPTQESSEWNHLNRKYRFQQLQFKNNLLIIEKQKLYALLASLLFVIVLALLFVFYVWKKRQNENQTYQLEQEKLHRKLEDFQHIFKEHQQETNAMEQVKKMQVSFQIDILKGIAKLKGNGVKTNKLDADSLIALRKINLISLGDEHFNLETLSRKLNELQEGLFERIKEHYSHLSSNEYAVCCLICSDYDNSDMALALNLSVKTIEYYKTSLKETLGVDSPKQIKSKLLEVCHER